MTSPVVIENPILNSPYAEPKRHFRFDETGITADVLEERRPSSHFVAIPPAKRTKAKQAFETEWTADRVEGNRDINRIREQVGLLSVPPDPYGDSCEEISRQEPDRG